MKIFWILINLALARDIFHAYCIRIDSEDILIKDYYVTSTYINNSVEDTTRWRREVNCKYLTLELHKISLKMCLNIVTKVDYNFIPANTPIYIYNGILEESRLVNMGVSFVTGYLLNEMNNTSIDGYIEDNCFYGRLIIGTAVYYIEKLDDYPGLSGQNENKAVVYKSNFRVEEPVNLFNRRTLKKRSSGIYGNICSLILVIDSSFVAYVGKNEKISTAIVVNSVMRADSIFRSTDFDGDDHPDNIGFRIKYMIIIKSNELVSYFPKYINRPMKTINYFLRLSHFPNFQESCAVITFTAQSFEDNVIGISYTAAPMLWRSGGICITGYKENYNLVLVTYFHTNGKRIPQEICDVSVAHELGHSFGSLHDVDETCLGYIMSPKATVIVTENTFSFSRCSRRQIYEVLKVRSMCLERNVDVFCGNGIVEPGEECDCGSYYKCIYKDRCCLPFTDTNGCRINRKDGYSCHPSEDLCCANNCQVRDISHLGLSCSNFRKKCKNRRTGTCGIDGYCMLNRCHSIECVRIGLMECFCPLHENVTSCFTCCYLNGNCLPATEATRIIVKNNSELITELIEYTKNNIFTKVKKDLFERFCYKARCVKLGFKVFDVDDFCLFNGRLGVCKESQGCLVNTNYMMIPEIQNGQSCSQLILPHYASCYVLYYVVCYIITIN